MTRLLPIVASALLLLPGCPSDDDDVAPGPPAPVADAGADVVVEVGVEATFDAGDSQRANTYAWDFGDGSSAAGVVATHAWDSPGHYSVVLTVVSEDLRQDTDAVRVDVVWPLADPAPSVARRIASIDDGATVLVALPDFDAVAAVDAATREVAFHDVCVEPLTVAAADPSSSAWVVACAGGPDADGGFQVWTDDLRVADVALATYGRPALAAVLDPSGDEIGVVHGGVGGLSHWTLTPFVQTTWFAPGDFPDARGFARLDDAYLVSRFRSEADGARWWSVPVGDPDDASPFELRVDPGPDSDTTTRGVPNYVGLTVSPDGRTVAFPSLQANILRGEFRDGLALTDETTARAVLSTASAGGSEGARKVFDNRDFASDVAFAPRGDWLYVAMLGMQSVEVLDAYTLETAGSFQGIGHGVDGVLVSPDGGTLYAVASYARELVVYDLDGPASGVEVARLDLRPGGVEVLDADVLRGKQLFHAAADPRISQDGYLSCGSCHLEGDGDGQTWDFTDRGEGLRNTIDLRGRAGTAHGPIHWSANFDEVQDFENDIRGGMGGAGLLSDDDFAATADTLGAPKAGLSEDLDALAAYVASLDVFPRSPFRAADGGLTSDAEAGRAIFNRAEVGCADCHPAPEYTDSVFLAPADPLLHDVGTLSEGSGGRLGGELPGLDTPTLRGVWSTPPYLHDGSAPTLRDVVTTANPDDLHGVTSALTDDEIDELVSFLEQIE